MTIHRLKLDSQYYDDSASGAKSFEIRKNDRNFKVGDILEMYEYIEFWQEDVLEGVYTHRFHTKIITYIFENNYYLQDGYVILCLAPIKIEEEEQ